MSVGRVARSVVASGASLGAMALATSANAAVIEISHNESFQTGGISFRTSFDIDGEIPDADFSVLKSESRVDVELRNSGVGVGVELRNSGGVFLLDEFGDPNFSASSLIDGSRSSAGETVSLADLSSTDADFGEPDISGFLGLELVVGGNTHFAWIEASVTEDSAGEVTAEIIRSGFEDVPGVGILAGSTVSLATVPLPGSLLLLASGVLGLAALRRRRNGAAS